MVPRGASPFERSESLLPKDRRPMPRFALLALALAACGGTSATTTPSPADPIDALIGAEQPPRAGIREVGSYLIDASDRGSGRWVLAEVTTLGSDQRRAIVLDLITKHGTPSESRWRTVAVQRIAPGDSSLALKLGGCMASGVKDHAVVALGRDNETVTRRAWRADTTTRSFKSIDAREISCEALTTP